MICARCKADVDHFTYSFFNTDAICMDCTAKEKAHPMYAKARAVELEHTRRGDLNFSGIGKPDDL